MKLNYFIKLLIFRDNTNTSGILSNLSRLVREGLIQKHATSTSDRRY